MDQQHPEPVALKPTKQKPDQCDGAPPTIIDGFDVNAYMEKAKAFDMTEAETQELLLILWDIMKRFVELGWGLDSVSLLLDLRDQDSSEHRSKEPYKE